VGGQERVALDLAAGQRALGCAVLAVSLAPPPDGPLGADFRAVGCEVATVPKRDGFDVTLPARLAWLFARRRVDVVHTHNPQPLIYGALASRLAGARAVHTKHGANPDTDSRVRLRRAAARLASAYVAVSALTADVARKNREVPERKLRTIPNGIDLSRFHPDAAARAEVRAELGIAAGAWVCGTVGRLAHEKDQALLLRAMAPLLDDTRRLVIVGDGQERAALEAQTAALGDRARFVHLVGERRDVPRLLAAFDAFALTSRTEGLPLVIPEAMATGLPVVSTAVGGIPGVVVEGETGFLVARADEPLLRERLGRLAGDAALSGRQGQRGRALALELYSAERMVRDYLALYRQILGRA
jgi:glycosyltransferase involved in cell wall biosynthesis